MTRLRSADYIFFTLFYLATATYNCCIVKLNFAFCSSSSRTINEPFHGRNNLHIKPRINNERKGQEKVSDIIVRCILGPSNLIVTVSLACQLKLWEKYNVRLVLYTIRINNKTNANISLLSKFVYGLRYIRIDIRTRTSSITSVWHLQAVNFLPMFAFLNIDKCNITSPPHQKLTENNTEMIKMHF